MLRRLSVTDFQSLAHVEVDLAPFTVIVGPSNSGKSALRRALEAMANNAPATGRLRTDASVLQVQVTTDEGHILTWEKGPKRNAYHLLTADGSELLADKPGASVPDWATDLLGLDDLNFADQFDPPYLITEQPSAAAKTLGALTNITVLYDGIREATRRQRSHTQTATTLGVQLASAQDELATYADLPAEHERLALAAQALEGARSAEQNAVALRHAVVAANAAQLNVATSEATLAALVDPAQALALIDTAYAAAVAAERQRDALERARQAAWFTESDLPPAPDLATVASALQACQIASDTVMALIQARTYADKSTRSADDAARYAADEATVRAELAAIDVCPLCNTPGVHLEAVS